MSTFLKSTEDDSAVKAYVFCHSPAIHSLNEIISEIALTDIPVLLSGESGTGKEVYGRLLHRLSKNCHYPLRKLNCRALEQGEFLTQLKSDFMGTGGSPEDGLPTLF